MRQQQGIDAAAALQDPVRSNLLHFVGAATQPVSRDAAAAALGVPRSTVAFHLDRLVEAGLLVVDYARVNGRTGPGSGRPAKMYMRSPEELSVSIPERHYDMIGDLLATALENADGATSAMDALRAAATDAGHKAGQRAGNMTDLLEQAGYEPSPTDHGTHLANCPFHSLVSRHTEVVCTANLAFLCAAAEAVGGDPTNVILDPTGAGCCVRLED